MFHRLYADHWPGPATRAVRIEPVRVRDLQILFRACAGGGQRRSASRASEQKDMCVSVRHGLHVVFLHMVSFSVRRHSRILRFQNDTELCCLRLITIISKGVLFHPLNTLGPSVAHSGPHRNRRGQLYRVGLRAQNAVVLLLAQLHEALVSLSTCVSRFLIHATRIERILHKTKA
jgi:hypothetical protein